MSFADFRPRDGAVLEGEKPSPEPRHHGATDPKKAAPGTIRADFADSIDANAVHGSDGGDREAGNRVFLSRHERRFALSTEPSPVSGHGRSSHAQGENPTSRHDL